jgi:uncharacterized membrane protein YcaP (DUF421 family)
MELDLANILTPDTSPAEIIVRGTITYVALLVLLRVALKRQTGSVARSDLLVIVLIADAAQNGMSGGYESIADGILLVGTLIFWSVAFDWLSFRFPAVESLIAPKPLPLIEKGRVNKRNLRAELITREELLSQLRLQGIDDPAQVERAFLEPNGEISVVPLEGTGS